MPRGGKRPGAGRKKGATAPYETLAVRVPPELLARLEEAAKRAGMPLADYVRRALNLTVPSLPSGQEPPTCSDCGKPARTFWRLAWMCACGVV